MSLTPITYGLQFESYADLGTYQDTALATAAIADGTTVGGWDDQNNIGNAATQATSGSRPLLKLNQINGKAALLFDGIDDLLLLPSVVATNTQAFTIFLVFKPLKRPITSLQVLLSLGADTTAFYTQTAAALYMGGTHANPQTQFGLLEDWQLVTVVGGTTTASGKFRINGYSVQPNAVPSAIAMNGGAIGAETNVTYPTNFYVASVLIYNSAFPDGDIVSVEAFLQSRYALPQYEPAGSDLVLFEGDSLTVSYSATDNAHSYPDLCAASLSPTRTTHVLGVGGSKVHSDLPARATWADSYYSSSNRTNLIVVWAGRNDFSGGGATPAQSYDDLKTYCAARKATGWTVLIADALPGTDLNEISRSTFNGLLATDFSVATADTRVWKPEVGVAYADGLVKLSNNTTIGQAGQYTNTIYYYTDQIHLTNAGYALVAGDISAGVPIVAPLDADSSSSSSSSHSSASSASSDSSSSLSSHSSISSQSSGSSSSSSSSSESQMMGSTVPAPIAIQVYTLPNSAEIVWTPPEDQFGVVVGYHLYRNSVLIHSGTEVRYTDGGLTIGTTYVYSVVAYDADGNTSAAISATGETLGVQMHANENMNEPPTISVAGVDLGPVVPTDQSVYHHVNVPTVHGPVTITLASSFTNAELRYTLSGKNPTPTSNLYTGPLTFRQNMTGDRTALKVRAYDKTNAGRKSKIIRAEFRIVPPR